MVKWKMITALTIVLVSAIGVVSATHSDSSTALWFVSWDGNSTEQATGNVTWSYQGFAWADTQLSTITVHVDWGDSTTSDFQSTGTFNTMNTAYTGFVNGPSHMWTKIGSYTFSVTLLDANNNFAQKSLTVNVAQGPNLSGVYGAGGHSQQKM